MKLLSKICLMSFLVILFSCSDEKLITEISPNKHILVAIHKGNTSKLTRLTFPDGQIIDDDVFLKANNKPITSNKITYLATYLQNIYVIIPDDYKIMVLDRTTFKLIAEYNFEAEKLLPRKIVFANATEGYLIFDNTNFVYLIDTYYNKIARKIELEGNPSDILAVGNQVYITLPLQNILAILDTRTHKVELSLQIT